MDDKMILIIGIGLFLCLIILLPPFFYLRKKERRSQTAAAKRARKAYNLSLIGCSECNGGDCEVCRQKEAMEKEKDGLIQAKWLDYYPGTRGKGGNHGTL